MIKECIAPEGSDRKNHRQDQALLTVLAHLMGLAPPSEQSHLRFRIQQDIDGLKNPHPVPSAAILEAITFPTRRSPCAEKLRAFLRANPC